MADLNGTFETHSEDTYCEKVLKDEGNDVEWLVDRDSIVLNILVLIFAYCEHIL